jgi:hypothetical protein
MSIDVPKEVAAIAQQNSSALGISVADYVAQLILGDQPEALSDSGLAASVASLDRAMEDVKAGRTLSATEARRRVEQGFGLRPGQ